MKQKTALVYYSDSAEEDIQLLMSGWVRHPSNPAMFMWLKETPRC